MRKGFYRQSIGMLALAAATIAPAQQPAEPSPGHPSATAFVNPLLPSGADPWITWRDGFYYYMNSTQNDLEIRKTRDIADLAAATPKVVWRPPTTGPYSHDIWAPELHYLRGRWYIYFAADNGDNATHRLYVLENASPDPTEGEWTFKGKIGDPTDRWAIDATVFENGSRLYMLWSGWEGDTNGQQNIYLAELSNPWTVKGARVRISQPQYTWEQVGDLPSREVLDVPHVNVNEGPEILQHDGQIFLTYSASGCWTDYYALGMAQAQASADLTDPASWHKVNHPVFQQSRAAMAFGTGHNSFFKSPDGKQDWLLYHANPAPGEGCGDFRAPRAQPFTWNADGTPNFGTPVPLNQVLERPSH